MERVPAVRDKIESWLRKTFFPKRDHQYSRVGDTTLKQNIAEWNVSNPNRSAAELELETRAWLRDFWSRSLVAWLALTISIIALVFSYSAKHEAERSRNDWTDNAIQEIEREILRSRLIIPTTTPAP